MKELKCPSCGHRLRKLGLESIYACDNHGHGGREYTIYWKFIPTLVSCSRSGYVLKEPLA